MPSYLERLREKSLYNNKGLVVDFEMRRQVWNIIPILGFTPLCCIILKRDWRIKVNICHKMLYVWFNEPSSGIKNTEILKAQNYEHLNFTKPSVFKAWWWFVESKHITFYDKY